MLRPLVLVVAAFSIAACGVSDDTELTSLDSAQTDALCAETCAGHEPFEIECDDQTYSNDDDEEACVETCVEAIGALEDCDKTVGNWRTASDIGPDSTCDEAEESFEAAFRIAFACTELGES